MSPLRSAPSLGPRVWQPLAAAGGVVAGVVTGTMTSLVHVSWFLLAWALLATAATAFALPPRWYGRIPYALGWVAVIVYLSTPPSDGGFIYGRDVTDYVVVYGATPLLLVICVLSTALVNRARPTRPQRPRPPRRPEPPRPASPVQGPVEPTISG